MSMTKLHAKKPGLYGFYGLNWMQNDGFKYISDTWYGITLQIAVIAGHFKLKKI
jgi:hypothetical protein